MKPPVLHIIGSGEQDAINGLRWLCDRVEDGSNWPEKYMDDEVARFLDFCEDCERIYVEKYGREKMDEKINKLRGVNSKNHVCPCECHPEGEYVPRNVAVKDTKTMERVRTLRMYLEGGGDSD